MILNLVLESLILEFPFNVADLFFVFCSRSWVYVGTLTETQKTI